MLGHPRIGRGSSINVQPTDERVDQVFARYARRGSPGCAVAVMKDGQVAYEQGYGLLAVGENRFLFEKIGDMSIEFIPAEGDAPSSLRTLTPEGEYLYQRVEAPLRNSVDSAQHVGLYHSPELDIEWRLVARDGFLAAQRRRYPERRLTPLFSDALRGDWGPLLGHPMTFLVIFGRDRHRTIDDLRVSGSGVRNLTFSKRLT